uniref:Uncharacterized protein n=1 Tax=Oryza punctata TaxID=4537 RepID=A0A0E0KZA2_ORYPU
MARSVTAVPGRADSSVIGLEAAEGRDRWRQALATVDPVESRRGGLRTVASEVWRASGSIEELRDGGSADVTGAADPLSVCSGALDLESDNDSNVDPDNSGGGGTRSTGGGGFWCSGNGSYGFWILVFSIFFCRILFLRMGSIMLHQLSTRKNSDFHIHLEAYG